MQLRSSSITGHVNPSQSHFRQTYVQVKYLGEGDNGYTFAAASRSLANQILASHGQRTQAFYDDIRANLVAVKFAKDVNLEGDLSNEIRFLTQSITASHPRITPCLDSHMDGAVQWLALPFCGGGDLKGFIRKHQSDLNTAFVWHVGLQLAQGIVFLLYGITDSENMTPARDWPSVRHGDVWSGNTLLSPASSSSGSFRDFPDIVIADFGRAQQLMKGATKTERLRHMSGQIADINQIGATMATLQEFANYAAGPTLTGWVNCLLSYGSNGERASDRITQIFLSKFMSTAKIERAKYYRPLSQTTAAVLAAPIVTNEELAIALTQLRK